MGHIAPRITYEATGRGVFWVDSHWTDHTKKSKSQGTLKITKIDLKKKHKQDSVQQVT